MKTTGGFIAGLFFIAVKLQAAVIVDDAAIVLGAPFFSSNPVLTLTQSVPDGQGLFAIEIEDLGASQFNFSYSSIAEDYALFNGTVGQQFTPAFVSANTPVVTGDGTGPGSSIFTFTLNQSRYFNYWDDRNFDGIANAADNFGWVQITRTGAVLTASSGATAIGGGIITGTVTQVPEPSVTLLLLGALLPLLMVRHCRRATG